MRKTDIRRKLHRDVSRDGILFKITVDGAKLIYNIWENAMENGLVSIVIPVYNSEKYLSECIDSILSQRYSNIEILIIDDESKDNSMQICREYEASDKRIKILHQKNGGIGKARNTGLKNAVGEYIMFVDSDDFFPDNNVIYDLVYAAEKTGGDIICGNYCRLIDDELVEANKHGYNRMSDITQRDFRFSGFFSGGILSYVWCKIYRKRFIDDNKICFGEYHYAEDKMFNFECYILGAAYGFVDENVYVYRKNTESVSWKYEENRCNDWINIIKDLDTKLQNNSLQNQYKDLEAYTLFFAMFFDAKMRYEYEGKKLSSVKYTLKQYMLYKEAQSLVRQMAKGSYLRGIKSAFWKIMLWGFCAAVNFHLYYLISVGIKLLIDLKIDARLSSVGRNMKKEE